MVADKLVSCEVVNANITYETANNWAEMTRLLKIVILVAPLLLSGTAAGQHQTPADTTENKLRFFDKIGHWLTAYNMTGPNFLAAERTAFKASAFAEVYVEATIEHKAWMFVMLNRVTQARLLPEERQNPHVLLTVKFAPNEEVSQYTIDFSITASGQVNENLSQVTKVVKEKFLAGKTFTDPATALTTLEPVLREALQLAAEKIGDKLAPNVLVRYNGELFWSGHTIDVLAPEGNYVELEAVDKNGGPLDASKLTWTNADPFDGHKGIVDMTGMPAKLVTLRFGGESLSVTLKRVDIGQDVNDLLKQLIVEALSTKKQEALDTLVVLRRDSAANATQIRDYIAHLESGNFPMEGTDRPVPVFANPILRADSLNLLNEQVNRDIARSLKELKRKARLRHTLRRKLNVVAFADLVVERPERMKDLLDELLRNSGRLVARLILNTDSKGQRDEARDIVLEFLNQNLEKIVGRYYPPELTLELPLTIPQATAGATFDPAKFLYVNPLVNFEGKEELITRLNAYLPAQDPPLYVFINYSHDLSVAGYQSRATGTQPVGLPAGTRYKVFTVVHMPGSVKESVFSNGDCEGTSTLEAMDACVLQSEEEQNPVLSFILNKARELNLSNKDVVAVVHCKACSEQPDDEKTIFDGSVEFNGIKRPTSLFKVGGSTCLSIFYNQVAGEEKLFAGLNSESVTISASAGSRLSVLFANRSELSCTSYLDDLDDYLVCGQSQVETLATTYIAKLYQQIFLCLASPVAVNANVDVDQNEIEALNQLINEFKLRGIDSRVTIVNESEFESIQDTFLPEGEVHLLLGKTSTGFSYRFYYRDGFLNYPGSKTLASGETISFNYAKEEVDQIRDSHLAKAIDDPGAIDELSKRPEAMLNIFERGMWVIKVTRETLAEVKVPVPMWNSQEQKAYPFRLQSTVAGIGDGVVDEFKSIPDLLLMGLSLFDKQEREGLWEAVKSINLETLESMFEEKAERYRVGGDVAAHEGGYDVVQVASMFWGGALAKGKKATDKAGEFVEVLEKLSDDLQAKLVQLSAQQRDQLLRDLGSSPQLLESITPDLVDAWRKLIHADIPDVIRKNPTYLKAISKQISNYGDKIAVKFERVLPHITPRQYDNFFEALDNPKSIDHVRSLVGDFENIPGISMTKYVNNSLPKVDIPAPSTWADPFLALPGETAVTFTRNATAKTLTPGQKIYRVLSADQRASGGFWTYELPKSKAGLFGDTAVRPEWNGGTYYVEYTVPESGLKVWDGPTAAQPLLEGLEEVSLPGGGIQIYIPDPYRKLGNEFDNLKMTPISL